ncbi:bifunctional [glutamate--ammonia ligase]-adenylyl-L-tyrosine phosphorylase/[glutamate--ammonia-ligase] adenylyltransferase [Marinibactrum halimedae]|uniref:Bifunctional glutamine synthetase adenylyltransferase/adenylyl-removing enzyme n=1 Tax=Marinibactrum halimedae TaxID=1444977 RepID=A0AA37T567_9GAMM|nr:bifunctional [glutamate--ammonia ligase]-adenylyl-L-tyrosine phosphorylase/[glutamate--ammonia-ligase] adenylyltransferase [Marinibactrum halimedae]MCD9459337.1 bifunctional [glutamate--ammonia ligase]-adenylyl-L-tyrosine phosphorylase/[glutamate--ammonia-ligase] adenylyltransferase [Marinibactrum halimedae]GLS25771.1 glutamate-ammonia-ligase adenylyltransferase [Marinibactrum halimedae]
MATGVRKIVMFALQSLPVVHQKHYQTFIEHFEERASPAILGQLKERLTIERAEQLAHCVVGSRFLSDIFISDPSLLLNLLDHARLDSELESGCHYTWIGERLSHIHCEDTAGLDRVLRQHRRWSMARIIWRELNHLGTFESIAAELTELATASVQTVLDFHYDLLTLKHGTPIGKVSGQPQPLMVLGMGKLGAWELNLSSDIDLIFAFPESGETAMIEDVCAQQTELPSSEKRTSGTGVKKATFQPLSNQEFFARLGQRMIKSLDATTADGFVFRVDMRLRPYGQSGALVSSFAALEEYYQTQGREWERYAMIKARVIAANTRGVAAEHAVEASIELMELLRPFSYRRYVDFSAITALRDMKRLIQREVKRKGKVNDVKLGEGGIREIEFILQAFQLIRGGREPELQERRVMKLLPILAREGHLPTEITNELTDAYVFLRRVEHCLQAFADRQTQVLPTDEGDRARLAFVMNYPDWPALEQRLDQVRGFVHAQFLEVVQEDEAATEAIVESQWVDCWNGVATLAGTNELSLSHDEVKGLCDQVGLRPAEAAFSALNALVFSSNMQRIQASGRSRFDQLMPRLLSTVVAECGKPCGKERESHPTADIPSGDQQANAFLDEMGRPASLTETLKRLLGLVEAVARRSTYAVLLLENPDALTLLVKLFRASAWIADQITRHPVLLEELLDPRNLYQGPDRARIRDELRQTMLRIELGDLEAQMETLRYFRMAQALRIAASEVSGALPLMKVSDSLTWLAEAILEHVLDVAWHEMVQRHGYPGVVNTDATGAHGSEALEEEGDDKRFIIVAYGKLGGIELGHGSDLDLVFVHDGDIQGQADGAKPLDNQTFYTRLGQKIIHILNTRTPSGQLYEVDMRLRPSGNSGLLVSSAAAFLRYQLNDAWTWEHQALVRARAVVGNPLLMQKFAEIRAQVLCQSRDLSRLKGDVLSMRKKMRDHLGSAAKQTKSTRRTPQNPPEKDASEFHLKQDSGGIVDIEFMVQYAALAWAHRDHTLIEFSDNIRILERLAATELIHADDAQHLIEIYQLYRATGHRLALQQQGSVISGDAFRAQRDEVSRLWTQLFTDESSARP